MCILGIQNSFMSLLLKENRNSLKPKREKRDFDKHTIYLLRVLKKKNPVSYPLGVA